jgi:hypothetical protein
MKTHGQYKSITYGSWRAMRRRCNDKKCKDYPRWGARGIKVCDAWLGDKGFANFINDMGPRPSKKFSLDRLDNEKGYFKENCRWATASEQVKNQRKPSAIPSRRAMDWALVVELRDAGFLGIEIASLFDVTPTAVCRVLKIHGKMIL